MAFKEWLEDQSWYKEFNSAFFKKEPLHSVQENLARLTEVDKTVHGSFSHLDILFNVRNPIAREYSVGDYTGSYKNYLLSAKNHIKQNKSANESHKKMVSAANVLVFVHPFYAHLTDTDNLDSNKVRKQANKYLSTMVDILDKQKNNPSYSAVMIGSAFHYAMGASFLMESNVIQDYFVTRFDGPLLDPEELSVFTGKNVYVGGTFKLGVDNSYKDSQTAVFLNQFNTSTNKINGVVTSLYPISDLLVHRNANSKYGHFRAKKLPKRDKYPSITSRTLLEKIQRVPMHDPSKRFEEEKPSNSKVVNSQ